MPIFSIIYNLLNSHLADKFFPEYFCKGKLSTETKSVICNKVSGLMINKLCQVSRNSFDSIFVSAFLGLKITAMYSNYYYIEHCNLQILLSYQFQEYSFFYLLHILNFLKLVFVLSFCISICIVFLGKIS